MRAPDEFWLVLSEIVLNRERTGYRGVYRTSPTSLAFIAERWDAVNVLTRAEGSESWFPVAAQSLSYARLAREWGYQCEVVRCVAGRGPGTDLHLDRAEVLLGWDVAEVGGGYSVIVDNCMQLWERRPDWASCKYATHLCIAEYFNAKLNAHRLFDQYEQAALFLRVDRECAERFEGEMAVTDLCPIAVVLCPEDA